MFVLGSSISVQVGKKTVGITNKWGVQLNIEGIEKKNQKLTSGGWGGRLFGTQEYTFIHFSIGG